MEQTEPPQPSTTRVDPPWEPPLAGTEVEHLSAALDRLRTTFRWKAGGLDHAGLQTRAGASDLTLGALLKHLAFVEDFSFATKLRGESPGPPWETVDWEADPRYPFTSAASDSPAELYALWDSAVDRARSAPRRRPRRRWPRPARRRDLARRKPDQPAPPAVRPHRGVRPAHGARRPVAGGGRRPRRRGSARGLATLTLTPPSPPQTGVPHMADVLLFHHTIGLTPGLVELADRWRAAGHTVHAPDLFGGRTFVSIDEGVAFTQSPDAPDFGAIAQQEAERLPAGLVYAGVSFGVMLAQRLAQLRPGAEGALLFEACLPITGDWSVGPWPDVRAGADPRQGRRPVLRRRRRHRRRTRHRGVGTRRRAVHLPGTTSTCSSTRRCRRTTRRQPLWRPSGCWPSSLSSEAVAPGPAAWGELG